MRASPRPCPFCGHLPNVGPADWSTYGDGWGYVVCAAADCHVHPRTEAYGQDDGLSAEAASNSNKAAAIAIWNKRA